MILLKPKEELFPKEEGLAGKRLPWMEAEEAVRVFGWPLDEAFPVSSYKDITSHIYDAQAPQQFQLDDFTNLLMMAFTQLLERARCLPGTQLSLLRYVFAAGSVHHRLEEQLTAAEETGTRPYCGKTGTSQMIRQRPSLSSARKAFYASSSSSFERA